MIFSATEAYVRSQDNIGNTKILQAIENQIHEAIKNGKFFITNDGVLPTHEKELLENLGYKVDCSIQYDKPYYAISWE